MDLEAFILIGGRSKRFGRDKAFAAFGGETLATRAGRVIETSLAPGQITYVTGAETQFDTAGPAGLSHPVIADLKPGFGAWSGIHAALSHARSKWALVLACDLPLVSAGLLQLLAAFALRDIDAVVPRQPDGRLQPLCAFYRVRSVLARVEEMLAGTARLPPLNTIFGRVKTRVVGRDEYSDLPQADELFLNVNNATDLALALARDQTCTFD